MIENDGRAGDNYFMQEADIGISSQIYLWIEDGKGKSGYMFWNTLMKQLCPRVIVESKKNNSELVKSVKALTDHRNQYIVVFDNSFDNMQVCLEQKILKKHVDEKNNVSMMNIICFEYILLEFDRLISWIYAPNDEFLIKRADAVHAREKLIETLCSGNLNYKTMKQIIKYDNHINEHNIEQLSAKLLFDLTRNTGFEVSKRSIGECWIKSCCNWLDRQGNDICGLDESRLSIKNKMKSIYMGTSLKDEFLDNGLEVI